ncbi:MAG: tRNA 5-methoxyuridine(34)/uridine 5-oxyacetic acid(34) synthase CmoB [Gammaproteobacteria bacterium]|nr:tRNA 5-methoxyuridine(34)/uridine 5-oxyacetic acid(34) synthase CmoB [Gammaproteobacteria bacterium]
MIDFQSLYEALKSSSLKPWLKTLPRHIEQRVNVNVNGNFKNWLETLEQLPEIETRHYNLNHKEITIGDITDCSNIQQAQLKSGLQQLHPWRKGPYSLFDIHIDSEWRSDLKWNRLAPHITPLVGRQVLDVGCGNGYHCWRMAGADAQLVIGTDPSLLFLAQFHALKRYAPQVPVHLVPFKMEDLPDATAQFDSVFSMGVLYHRRSPIDHLLELRQALRPGGELILETLVVPSSYANLLVPRDRYAKMRNVWFIPDTQQLETWLQRCHFENIRVIDVSPTTIEEQRTTSWMQFESLPDFLATNNIQTTIEGYPAPLRAIVIANRNGLRKSC